jgi:hypothetical protein
MSDPFPLHNCLSLHLLLKHYGRVCKDSLSYDCPLFSDLQSISVSNNKPSLKMASCCSSQMGGATECFFSLSLAFHSRVVTVSPNLMRVWACLAARIASLSPGLSGLPCDSILTLPSPSRWEGDNTWDCFLLFSVASVPLCFFLLSCYHLWFPVLFLSLFRIVFPVLSDSSHLQSQNNCHI